MYFTTYTQKNLGGCLIHNYNPSLALITEQAQVFIEMNWLRCQRRNSRQNWDIRHVGGCKQLEISAHADRMDSHSEKRRLPKALRFGILTVGVACHTVRGGAWTGGGFRGSTMKWPVKQERHFAVCVYMFILLLSIEYFILTKWWN